MTKLIPVLLILAFLSTDIFSQADNNNSYVHGQVIVMLKKSEESSRFTSDFSSFKMKVKERLVPDMNIWLFEYDYNSTSPENFLNSVRRHKDVFLAQFNHYVTQRSSILTPNDPSFGQQWSLNNTGQNGGTPDADIDAPEAWTLNTGGITSMGDTIVVAIVDGGFYQSHPDISFWHNWYDIPGNGIDDDGNGYVDDYNGWNAFNNTGNITGDNHGTHCSGIAGAVGNNNTGISGVNWNVKIMGVMGSSGTESVVVAAYGYVLKQRKVYNQTNGQRGAFVVATSSSFGVDLGQPANYPLWCAFYDTLGTYGILSAAATANANWNIDSLGDIPTACPSDWLISVTNTTNTDAKNSGAAYGHLTIDLGAPGTNIYSTYGASGYQNLTGTSMATPHVAGAVGFMFAVAGPTWIQQYKSNPGPNALIVKQKILQGVDPKPSLQNITVSGGRLNLYNSAVLMQNLTAAGNENGIVPKLYNLYQNYPNPFNPSTVITYDLPKTGFVSLKIYDALGREISTLVNGNIEADVHQAVWNAKDFTSGVYFYKLETSEYTATKKMALIK